MITIALLLVLGVGNVGLLLLAADVWRGRDEFARKTAAVLLAITGVVGVACCVLFALPSGHA